MSKQPERSFRGIFLNDHEHFRNTYKMGTDSTFPIAPGSTLTTSTTTKELSC